MPAAVSRTIPDDIVRSEVAKILKKSAAFNALTPGKKIEVAKATAEVANYLVKPEGIHGSNLLGGLAMPPARALDDPAPQREATYAEASKNVDAIGKGQFKANAAREGAEVAGLLLNQVKFPVFVASLIEGVFHSIVKSSMTNFLSR